jgi:hypothetical protein
MPHMYCSLRGLLYSPFPLRVLRPPRARRTRTPRPSTTREILVAKVGNIWARINRKILPEIATSTSIRGSFTCRKSTTWDPRLCFPSEEGRAEKFFALKNSDGFGRVWTRELGHINKEGYAEKFFTIRLYVIWCRRTNFLSYFPKIPDLFGKL